MSGVRAVATADESDYDRQRRENIEANNKRLDELGLHQHGMLPAARIKPPAAKRARKDTSLKAAEAMLMPQRRSGRNMGKDAPNYKEASVSYGAAADGAWSSSGGHAAAVGAPFKWVDDNDTAAAGKQQQEEEEEEEVGDEKGGAKIKKEEPATDLYSFDGPADSSKNLFADVEGLLSAFLGKEMPETGKRAVMEACCASKGVSPRYNKYCGVSEWRNAVTLFVNIGGDTYENQFRKSHSRGADAAGGKEEEEEEEEEEGFEMTWFGGSRQAADNKTIQKMKRDTRLKSSGAGGSPAPAGSDRCSVLLFIRLPGEKKGQFTPYVFCGRCKYVSCNMDVMPVQFLWKLVDYQNPSLKESDLFAQIRTYG